MKRILDRLWKGWRLIPEKGGTGSQADGNNAVRATLRSHGDDGTRARHVIHYAYHAKAANPADRPVAQKCILEIGEFSFSESAHADGMVFEQNREVASVEFDRMTGALNDALAAIGWEYDGWECAVETGGD